MILQNGKCGIFASGAAAVGCALVKGENYFILATTIFYSDLIVLLIL